MATSSGPGDIRSLAAWLADRRWYGEKSRDLVSARSLSHVRLPEEGVDIDLELIELSYVSGPSANYVLIRERGNPNADGIEDDRVRAWLMNGFAQSRSLIDESGGLLQWVASPELTERAHQIAGRSRLFRGQQSNTSMVFADSVMVKLFRNIRFGINPEIEVGNFLTAHTDFRAFPRLLGEIVLDIAGVPTTVAAAQEFIPSVGDAWGWITERIDDPSIRESTILAARTLGIRTGEMHVAFASGESEAFAPERATAEFAASVRETSQRELAHTIRQLTQAAVHEAGELEAPLAEALEALKQLDGTTITRIHGDYHLGQVLRTVQEDFAILDFEGEPARSLDERRAKASPLRDVAGMLRSFDYAAETARRSADGQADDEVADWYRRSRGSFLEGYDAAIEPCEALQTGWCVSSQSSALAAFEIHKALYEVRYELSNRPDWVDIPLNALRRTVERQTAG